VKDIEICKLRPMRFPLFQGARYLVLQQVGANVDVVTDSLS
jgi:hypothetical protein